MADGKEEKRRGRRLPQFISKLPGTRVAPIVGTESVPADILQAAANLRRHGVAVVRVCNDKQLRTLNKNFWDAVVNFPEYKNPTKGAELVMGGFGALANPASFHNPMVRAFRLFMMRKAVALFSIVDGSQNRKLEMLPDRMSIRRPGTATTAEAWHRDQSPGLADSDDVFGGWVNLNRTQNQYFSCVPGTHADAAGIAQRHSAPGFGCFDKKAGEALARRRQRFTIPPGHWIVFYQHIAHEVVARKMDHVSIRIYCGFRLTHSEKPLFDTSARIAQQGILKIPSGQEPPMFGRNHLSFWGERIDEFSQQFKNVCIEGERVPRFMHSLQHYRLQMYEAYKPIELQILTPQRKWNHPALTAEMHRVGKYTGGRIKKQEKQKEDIELQRLLMKPADTCDLAMRDMIDLTGE